MRKSVLWLLVLAIAAAMGGSVAYAVRPYVDAATAISQITGVKAGTRTVATFTPVPSTTTGTGVRVTPTAMPTPRPTAIPIHTPKNRVNLLVLASDNDAKNSSTAFPNTQVMIYLSLDPVQKQVYMISIPRDLWVPIPGWTTDKIDTATAYGDISLAIKTVEANFGVHIDHYAWVGLNGFIKIINSVGGIDINVLHPMVENDFPDDIQQPNNPYAYRRFYIPAGPQHFDGETAELYVRARHSDLLSDFGRSQRQQQTLLALKQKIEDRLKNGDFNLASLIVQDLKGEAQTDMQLPDILGLARPLLGIQRANIHQWVLTGNIPYTHDQTLTMPNGTKNDVVIPNWDAIRPLFACVDSDQASKGCPGL